MTPQNKNREDDIKSGSISLLAKQQLGETSCTGRKLTKPVLDLKSRFLEKRASLPVDEARQDNRQISKGIYHRFAAETARNKVHSLRELNSTQRNPRKSEKKTSETMTVNIKKKAAM